MIHQLALIHACAADQLFERDVIQDGADGTVHFRPDRSEVARCLFAAIIAQVSVFQTGELNEGPAHAPDHITDADLAWMAVQYIASFSSSLAPDNVDPFQDLHDLKQKLRWNPLTLRDVALPCRNSAPAPTPPNMHIHLLLKSSYDLD